MYLLNPTGEKVRFTRVCRNGESFPNGLIITFKDLSKAFFVSATGYKMLFKVYYLLSQRKEYRALVNDFQYSMAFRPQNKEEEKYAHIQYNYLSALNP